MSFTSISSSNDLVWLEQALLVIFILWLVSQTFSLLTKTILGLLKGF